MSARRSDWVMPLVFVAVAIAFAVAWRVMEPPRRPVAGSALTADELLEEGRGHYEHKDYTAARRSLEACLEQSPSSYECHKLLGATLGRLGDGPGGAEEYELFLRYAPSDHPQREKVKRLLDVYRGYAP